MSRAAGGSSLGADVGNGPRSRRQDVPIFLRPQFPPLSVTYLKSPLPHDTLSRKFKAEVNTMPIDKAESSRINGAKSRGTVTPEGKQRSCLNAVRHGLFAKVHCLTNENQGLLKELLQDYLTRLLPTDMVELRLVEQVALAAFRLERIVSMETALFDREMDEQTKQREKEFPKMDPAAVFALAFKSLADNSKSLHLYLRYEVMLTRQYDRAMKQLIALRTKFPAPQEAELPNEPTEPETDCVSNKEGVSTEPTNTGLPTC